jgi:hypothetical protein
MDVVGVGVGALLEEVFEEELHAAPSAMNVKAAPARIHGRLPPACFDVNIAASVFSFELVATQLPRVTVYTPSVPTTAQPRKGAL